MTKYFDKDKLSFMDPHVKEQGGHMVMTNVFKETQKKYLNIDTRFQEDYQSEKYADFTINLPQSINNVQSMKVLNIEIPASMYNFSLQRKNTFFTVENSANQKIPIVIEDGNYTLASLAEEIERQFRMDKNGIDDIVVTIDESTHKIMFNYSTENIQGTKKYILHFDVDESGNMDATHYKSKLGWLLGFRDPSYIILESGYIISETFVNLHSLRYLYLNIDEYSQSNANSFITPTSISYTNPHAIARVVIDPNTHSFGTVICGNIANGTLLTNRRTYKWRTDIQRLSIQLLDECGNKIDLNQMDFSFALEIEYV